MDAGAIVVVVIGVLGFLGLLTRLGKGGERRKRMATQSHPNTQGLSFSGYGKCTRQSCPYTHYLCSLNYCGRCCREFHKEIPEHQKGNSFPPTPDPAPLEQDPVRCPESIYDSAWRHLEHGYRHHCRLAPGHYGWHNCDCTYSWRSGRPGRGTTPPPGPPLSHEVVGDPTCGVCRTAPYDIPCARHAKTKTTDPIPPPPSPPTPTTLRPAKTIDWPWEFQASSYPNTREEVLKDPIFSDAEAKL